jgi:hypothetical protein
VGSERLARHIIATCFKDALGGGLVLNGLGERAEEGLYE